MQGVAQYQDMRAFKGATQLASFSGRKVAPSPQNARQPRQRGLECAASSSGVKLPATHLQSSQRALQDLQTNKNISREFYRLYRAF